MLGPQLKHTDVSLKSKKISFPHLNYLLVLFEWDVFINRHSGFQLFGAACGKILVWHLKTEQRGDSFVPSFNDVKMNQYKCRDLKWYVNVSYQAFSVQEVTDLTQTELHYGIYSIHNRLPQLRPKDTNTTSGYIKLLSHFACLCVFVYLLVSIGIKKKIPWKKGRLLYRKWIILVIFKLLWKEKQKNQKIPSQIDLQWCLLSIKILFNQYKVV